MIEKKKRVLARYKKCAYCIGKTEPDYKQVDVLRRHVSDRGKILSSDKSGICSKHQRGVSVAVKRARHLALLPFVSGL